MKKSLKTIFIYIPIGIVIILIFLFFLITSSFGIKNIVFPVAGKALGMPIEVSSAKLHLLHPYIEINDLTVGEKSSPLIIGEKFACSFSLRDILYNKNIKVNSIVLKNISVTMTEDENGKWNAPFMNQPPAPKSTEKIDSVPLLIDISNINWENLKFNYKDKSGLVFCIHDFGVNSPLLKNNIDSEIKLNGKLSLLSKNNVNIDSADIAADIKVNLSPNYIPQFLDLVLIVSNLNGDVKGSNLADNNLKLTASINHNENAIDISSIALQSFSAGQTITDINITGKAALAPQKVDLKVNIAPLGSDTINLITNIFYGLDLGSKAALAFNGEMSYSKENFSAKGTLNLSDAAIEIPGDLTGNKSNLAGNVIFDLTSDMSNKKAEINVFGLNTSINNKELVKVFIKKPLLLNWNKDKLETEGEVPEIFLAADKFDLLILKPFFDESLLLKGYLTSDLKIQADMANMNFVASGKFKLSDVSYEKDKLSFKNIDLDQNVDISLINNKTIDIKTFDLTLFQNKSKVSMLSLKGNYDLQNTNGALALKIPQLSPSAVNLISPNFVGQDQAPLIKEILTSLGLALDAETSFAITKDNKLSVDSLSASMNTDHSGTLIFALNSPLVINMDGQGKPLDSNISLNSSIKNFDLSKANIFLSSDSGMTFNKGILNLLARVSIDKKDFDINSDIQGEIKGLDLLKDKQNYKNIDLTLQSSLEMIPSKKLSLNKMEGNVLYGGGEALILKGKGELTLAENKNISLDAELVSNELFLQALNLTGTDGQKLGDFDLRGTLGLKTDQSKMFVDANFNLPKFIIYNTQNPSLSKTVNGTIAFSMAKDENQLDLKTAKISFSDQKIPFVNIASSGKVLFNSDAQSSLDINSDKLDLKKVMDIYSAVFAQAPKKAEEKKRLEAEPAPIELKGINLVSNINFNDIEYGPLINARANGVFTIKNNKMTLDPAKILINDSEATLFFTMNPSYADGYTYEFKETLKNLDINPFLKTFIEGNYSNTNGNIILMQTNLSGKGFTDRNLNKYLIGNFQLDSNNISLPNDITNNRILALIILPIRVIANTMQFLPNTKLPDFMNQIVSITNGIMEQKKNLDFNQGQIRLDISNGFVNVKSFDFRGGDHDIIKYIKANGKIGFDSSLAINTNTNLSNVDIPFSIGGTIDKPEPNYSRMAAQIIASNAASILSSTTNTSILNNPETRNVTEPVTRGVKSIINLFDF